MRLVVTSDLHVHQHRVGSVDGTGRDRLADGLSALEQTLAIARERRAVWVFLGDFKVPKSVWPVEALNGALATLKRFADVVKVAIPGNHDTVDGAWGSGLEPFRGLVKVYDRPSFDVAERGSAIAAWPWGARHADELLAFLDEAAAVRRRAGPVVLLAHLMLAGSVPEADAARPGRAVAVDAFRPGEAFDVALVGDVHRGQAFASGTWRPFAGAGSERPGTARRRGSGAHEAADRIGGAVSLRAPGPWRGEAFYPGSPYQQNWGERDDWPKGALVVDVATGAVELAPVRAPRFREVEAADAADVAALLDRRPDWAGDVVRLVAPADVLAARGVASMVRALAKASGARELRAVPRHAVADARRAPVDGGMTPAELVRAWAKARPLEGADPAVVERAGLELLVERGGGDGRVA